MMKFERLKSLPLLVALVTCMVLVLASCGKECAHQFEGQITHQASCTEEGERTLTCSLCGQTATEIIPKLDHAYNDGYVTREATCSEAGVMTYTCSCGDSYTETIPAGQHEFDEGVMTRVATCGQEGTIVHTCQICGAVEAETIPGTGEHLYDNGEVTRVPTCTQSGMKTYICVNCGDNYVEELAPADHNYGSGRVNKTATCTETGIMTYTCQDCGQVTTKETPMAEHSYDGGKVTKAATCSETGVKSYTCAVCGATRTETVARTSHSYDSGKVTKAATCTATGTKAYTCQGCGATKTETVAKKNHSYDSGKVTKAATCTAAGTKVCTCTGCGTTKTETVAALGHQYNSNNVCSRCGTTKPGSSPSASEQEAAKRVRYFGEEYIEHNDAGGYYALYFTLADSSRSRVAAPANVELKLLNGESKLVYSAVKSVRTGDFATVSVNGQGPRLMCVIKIYDSEIQKGAVELGNLYIKVSNKDGYFNFDEKMLAVKGLPVQGTTITLPKLPAAVDTYIYGTTVDCTFSITKVEYKIVANNLYLYFSGEKTYERSGRNKNQTSEMSWTLYNSNDRVVAKGTVTIPALGVGKSFTSLEANAWNCIKTGESYRLVIGG